MIRTRSMGAEARRAAGLLALLIIPSTAGAADLQGTWQYQRTNTRGEIYSGNVVIAAGGKASDVTQRPNNDTAAQSGYVAINGNNVEIVFTQAIPSGSRPYSPDHFRCTIKTPQQLECANVDAAGTAGYPFPLTRTGTAPRR